MQYQLIPPNPIEQFLNTTIYSGTYFIFDYWMLIHLGAGLILSKFIKSWKIAILILIAYEALEATFWGIFFRPEPLINVIWDIIFGTTGYFIAQKIFKQLQW